MDGIRKNNDVLNEYFDKFFVVRSARVIYEYDFDSIFRARVAVLLFEGEHVSFSREDLRECCHSHCKVSLLRPGERSEGKIGGEKTLSRIQ